MDYRAAGVDVEAGRAFVKRIKAGVEATHRPEVVGGLGGFGGMIRLPAGIKRPLLVSGTDGVGTKLELAQEHQAHHNVGIDLVAMCERCDHEWRRTALLSRLHGHRCPEPGRHGHRG